MKRFEVTFVFEQIAGSHQDAADTIIEGLQSGDWNGHLLASVREYGYSHLGEPIEVEVEL